MMMRAYKVMDETRAREIGAAILAHDGWEPGKASHTAAQAKRNLELKDSDALAKPLLAEITKALREHQLFTEHLVEKICPPKFNWYRDEGAYDIHSDAAFMGPRVRTDLACTLFLTDGYEGGELCVDGKTVKGRPGMAVVYDCWRPHWVNPVTSGNRVAFITWMQSLIAESEQREILNLIHSVAVSSGNQEHFAKLGAAHEKLVKMWAR